MTKKPSSKDKLLLFLCKNGNGTYHYEELRNFVGVKHRQFFIIINQLKKSSLLSIEPCRLDKRKRNFTLKENTMARLKKRNVIPFDRETCKADLGKLLNRKLKRTRPIKESIMIPSSVMEVLVHWNKQSYVRKCKIPKIYSGHNYAEPTNTLCNTVSTLRQVIVGRNFMSPIEELVDRIRPFSVKEIKTAIDRYMIAVTSILHEPRDKKYFKHKLPLHDFLFNSYSNSKNLMFKSPFLYFVENEPELLREQIYLAKVKKEDWVEREWLELITDELAEGLENSFGIERNAMVEAASIKLYDFAEDHGGVYVSLEDGLHTWPYWLVKALEWKKENSKKGFIVNSFTLLHDWIYSDVLISYVKYIQADHTITFPKIKRDSVSDT